MERIVRALIDFVNEVASKTTLKTIDEKNIREALECELEENITLASNLKLEVIYLKEKREIKLYTKPSSMELTSKIIHEISTINTIIYHNSDKLLDLAGKKIMKVRETLEKITDEKIYYSLYSTIYGTSALYELPNDITVNYKPLKDGENIMVTDYGYSQSLSWSFEEKDLVGMELLVKNLIEL